MRIYTTAQNKGKNSRDQRREIGGISREYKILLIPKNADRGFGIPGTADGIY